jgi:hypothetical protein
MIFGLASLAAAFAPDINVLNGLRFIMGVGLVPSQSPSGIATLAGGQRPDRGSRDADADDQT